MTPVEKADEAAGNLARAYTLLGIASFTIRTVPGDNGVRIVAPSLPPAAVAQMLHAAADAYLSQAPDATLQ
jgi:hypothetical protein